VELDPEALADDVAAVSPAARDLDADPWRWVLGGGEDHALAGTVPPGTSLPKGVRVIGRALAGDASISVRGRELPDERGWDSYR
jgi:thiamine-monophosphate kinase